MISFDSGNQRFNLRAAAVLIQGDRVLLHQLDGDSFWALPGGRVNAGESAEEAVIREMREELSEVVDCDRLLFVAENFFHHAGHDQHEVGLYFAVSVDASSPLVTTDGPYSGSEGEAKLTFRVVRSSELACHRCTAVILDRRSRFFTTRVPTCRPS